MAMTWYMFSHHHGATQHEQQQGEKKNECQTKKVMKMRHTKNLLCDVLELSWEWKWYLMRFWFYFYREDVSCVAGKRKHRWPWNWEKKMIKSRLYPVWFKFLLSCAIKTLNNWQKDENWRKCCCSFLIYRRYNIEGNRKTEFGYKDDIIVTLPLYFKW